MQTRSVVWTSLLWLLASSAAAPAARVDPELAAAEQALKEAKVGTDGPALLAFFRQRTLPPADRKKLDTLIRQLGDEDFEVRRKAARQLRAAGKIALSLLKKAAKDEDPEVARQARECLQVIEQGSEAVLVAAAAQVLAARKPMGAIEVLLAYLTTAQDLGDESVEEAVLDALAAVGVGGAKADPALVRALTAKGAAQRAAAGFVLGKGARDQWPAVRRLLADPVLRVRFQTARGLFRAGDKASVPALIDLLGSGGKDEPLTWQAEDLLCQLLGNQDPPGVLGKDEDARKKCVTAWKKWWKTNEAKVDLTRLGQEKPLRGLTLICSYDGGGNDHQGLLRAIGRDGTIRWQLQTGLGGPLDFQLLPNGNVLLTEHMVGQVSERDRKGKVVWQKKAGPGSVSCRRLRNGNTFIATYSELLEVNRKGETVYSHKKPHGIYCAAKMRNGHIVYVHNSGKLIELDAKGKEIKSFNIVVSGWCGIEVLRNGNYLVAQYGAGNVVELDRKTGKEIWKHAAPSPAWATRLPNGNTLITLTESKKVIEVDRKGKEVWKKEVTGRPFRVRRY